MENKEKQCLFLAIEAGRIMLENGAETNRIEDTMMRILSHLKVKEPHVFVTTTGLFVSSETETSIYRVTKRGIHLTKIAMVNDMSRKLVNDEITYEDGIKLLAEIDKIKPYNNFIRVIVTSLSCLCFTYLFGGRGSDLLASLLTGFILSFVLIFLNKKNTSAFLTSLTGGGVVGISTLLILNLGIGLNMDKIIIGAIMPLVPGVGITNSIRDVLEGDFMSGSGRILEAFLVASAIAVGVGCILKVWFSFFGGVYL